MQLIKSSENKLSATLKLLLIFAFSILVSWAIINGKLYVIGIALFLGLITIEPVAGLMASLVLESWFSYVDYMGFPPRNYVIAYLFAAFLLTFLAKRKTSFREHDGVKGFYILFGIYILLSLITNITHGKQAIDALEHMFARQIMPLMISLLLLFWINSERTLKVFTYFAITVISISAFVGIMQYFGFEPFWDLRLMLGGPENIPGIELDSSKSRITGLALFAVPLSYQLSLLIPMAFALFLRKGLRKTEKAFLIIAILLMYLATFMTLVRSAIIGVIFGSVFIAYVSSKANKFKLISLIILLGLSVFFFSEAIFERFTSLDGSAYGRLPLALAGLKLAALHPLGIGEGNYQYFASEMYYGLSHLQGAEFMLITSSHNQFINVLVSFGFPGLFLLIIFYVEMSKRLFKPAQYPSEFLNSFRVGCIGALASYTINSIFHNAGLFYGDVFVWYFVGLIFVYFKLSSSGNRRGGAYA
jgi:hypothetical protein